MASHRDVSVKELQRRHKGYWLAVRVTRETKNGLALRGELVAKARSYSETWEKARAGGLFVFKAGPMRRRAMVL